MLHRRRAGLERQHLPFSRRHGQPSAGVEQAGPTPGRVDYHVRREPLAGKLHAEYSAMPDVQAHGRTAREDGHAATRRGHRHVRRQPGIVNERMVGEEERTGRSGE